MTPVELVNRCQPSSREPFPETPPLLAKDPALMIRADTTTPVVNDEEKLARATTQAHKVARDGYRFDVGTFAIWAGCDRAITLVAGAQHVGVLRLLFARWLRLRRKWRDVMDHLRVVLMHAPDVSARTAKARVSRVLARQRQIFGGVLPTRRTGRSVEQVIVSRTECASSATSELRHVAGRLDSFVRPKAWEAIPFVGLEDYRRSRRGGLHLCCGVFRTGSRLRFMCLRVWRFWKGLPPTRRARRAGFLGKGRDVEKNLGWPLCKPLVQWRGAACMDVRDLFD